MKTPSLGALQALFLFLGSTGIGFCGTNSAGLATRGGRVYVEFDAGWRFSKGDFTSAMAPGFNDAGWRQVEVPHDWSSEGPFSAEYGSGNGFAPGGVGWYRKRFTVDASQTGKVVAVEFDGVYDHAEVWLNGHFVGGRPYGYSSFECLLTPLVKFGSGENVLAVRVDHSRFADSRWYTGSGIYRHVRLRVTDPLHVEHWGTFVTTPEVTREAATVSIETSIENSSSEPRSFLLRTELLAPDGTVAGTAETSASIKAGTNEAVVQATTVPRPQCWSVTSPVLYTLKTRLSIGDEVVDETTTRFGIRTIRFDADKGFSLNGEPMKLKGVCVHHEAGALGAAVPDGVWGRRLRLLKELGVNAIRTSHNPPAPELLDWCDRLGLLVKDEAFDEFTPAKNKWVKGRNSGEPSRFGYAESFDQWSVRDIEDMVRRDRNHPSVILWSIGNEIDYANDPFTHPILGNEYRPTGPPAQQLVTCARPLIAAVKRLDPTRPVTAALANVAMSDAVGLPDLLDIVGYNYQEWRYAADHQKYPKRILFGSENGGQLANWSVVRTNDYVAGQFLWTGIDYLGEANAWPNRGSGAGLLDLCGFKKPVAWIRQSLWSDRPMVYLCASTGGGRGRGGRDRGPGGWPQEHWNWPTNSTLLVRCCTTCPEVSLSLNGKAIGSKRLADSADGMLSWEVPFEPGVLKAEGTRDGKVESEFVLQTAGPASRIELVPDVTELRANAQDVCHLEFRIVDAQGIRVPDAGPEVKFSLEGPGKIVGVDNGDLNSPETGKEGSRAAYRGRGLAIVQSLRESGKIRLIARADGLKEAKVEINAQP